MSEPTIHEVSRDLTRLREQMNTHQAKYEGALDRFRVDMEKFRVDMEKFRADMEKFRADADMGKFRADADMGMFRADMGMFRTDMEKFRADLVQRESNLILWLIGIWVGGVIVTIAILGIFIRLAI